MSDQTNVFAEQPEVKEPTQAQQQNQAPDVNSQYADLLNAIKNEQGQPKYDSLPKALEALVHSQQYIPQLKTELQTREQELATLRAELEKRSTVEDVVSRLTAQQDKPQDQGTPPATSGLDEQAVLQLVQKALAQTKQVDQAAQNTAQVQQALTSMYGEKSREVVEQKARELGTTPKELGDLASKNPNLVLALFNAAQKAAPKTTTGSVHLPSSYMPERKPLERPSKSLLSGATSRDQADFMARIKEEVYARHGVNN